MNENKKKFFPKAAWFLVFNVLPSFEFTDTIYCEHVEVGEFGFSENVFVYGYSNHMV